MSSSHPSPRTLRSLSAILLALCLTISLGLGARPALAAGTPLAGLSVPATGFIGEPVTFTVSFDNTSASDAGYGPYIDLALPAAGADGDDGITFASATYLGTPVIPVIPPFICNGSFTHPLTGLSTSCTAGAQIVILQPPYGSFTATQPPADIVVTAAVSNLADLNTALTIEATAGFFLGNDALDNPGTDAPIIQPSPTSATFTPILWRLTKTYIGPEDETATGPNFPRQYRIDIDIADGQPITNLEISDILPPSMQFIQVDEVTAASGTPTVTAVATPSTTTPGGTLTRRLSSVTGTAGEQDASLLFSFFVPRLDAASNAILPAASGDDALAVNDARASGSWDPIDNRDALTTVTNDLTTNDHTLEQQSIAIQKSATNLTDTINTPGDLIEYTLDIQVSDYFAFDDVIVTDVLGDGLRFDDSFDPTLVCIEHGTETTGDFGAANYTVSDNWTDLNGAVAPNPGQPSPPHISDPTANDGTTTLTFRLSDQLAALGADGRLIGGGIPATGTGAGPLPNNPPLPFGATTCQLTYRATIQDQFSDDYPSGDQSVDQGDVLANTALVDGAVLQVSDLTPTGAREDDDTADALEIGRGELSKTIYAINGDTSCLPGDCSGGAATVIKPGDTVTYRLRLTLPSSDIEELRLVDYLPLPIFDVSDSVAPVVSAITSFDPTVSAAPPPAGTAKFGPDDDFTAESGRAPTISLDPVANSVIFDYGSYDDPNNTPNTIDLLFTVTASFDPFADKLLLTNQLRELETSTNAGDQVIDQIVQLTINEPELRMRKGVVATSTIGATPSSFSLPAGVAIDPAAACDARLSGSVTSINLGATFDNNVSGVDAGDQVTFAIVIENTGSGPNGAFDVRVRDELPAGLSFVPGSLCVNRGADGAEMPFTTIGGGLFDPDGGIELIDPGPTTGALGPGESRLTTDLIADGNNIAIVTFNAVVTGDVGLNQTLTNQGFVYHYANKEGGDDFTRVDLSDPATVTSSLPRLTKSLVATSEAHTSGSNVTIGEIVRYRLAVQLPEGSIGPVTLRDQLPTGLTFLDDGTARVAFVANGGGISSSTLGTGPGVTGNSAALADLPSAAVSFPLPDTAVSSSATAENDSYNTGTDPYFKLGEIVNADNDDDSEYLVVEFNALVDNTTSGSNDAGENRNNNFQFHVGTSQVGTNSNTIVVTIAEPNITTTKSVTPDSGDAGDTVTYTVVIANTGGNSANRTTAFDVVMSDPLPAALEDVTLVGATAGGSGAVTGLTSSLSGSTITVTADSMDSGATITVTYTARLPASVTPGQLITNEATTTYTSLPGAQGTTSNPTGSSVPGSPGSGTGERTGSGSGPNDLHSSDDATVTVFVPAPVKSIVATSEAHTSGSNVAVGEIVRYRLVVRIAEGTSPAVQLRDNLPAGMRFLNDGTARVALVSSDPGLSSSTLSGPGLQVAPADESNINSVTPSFVVPASAIPGGTGPGGQFQSGDDPVFALGDLTNTDSDTNEEFVVLEFNALVENVANNQASDTLNNSFTVRFGGSDSATSASVPVTIVEPAVTIAKRALTTDGSAVVYEIVASNTGNATAFDLIVRDVLPAELDLDAGSITAVAAGGATAGTANHNDAANRVEFTDVTIPPGGSLTITYQASVVAPGVAITNTASTTYTSLPGPQGTTSNPTGSATPPNGERDGSGGVNDYAASDSETLGSLGDRVWYDVDGDGVQDAGELGIPGVSVTVRWFGPDGVEGNADDSVITTTTDANGNYLVSALPLGGATNYRVTVDPDSLPSGLTVNTYDRDSGTTSPDNSSAVALTAANPNPRDLDFGYRGAASLGDRVWLDINGDGVQDAGEPGLPGAGVTLTWLGFDGVAGGGDDVTYTATTSNLGAYSFANLPAGNFTVSVDNATLPDNVTQTYDLNGGLDNTAARTLASGEAADDVDFGYRGDSAIGDLVWYDVDGDGTQNNDEPGIPGATVTLIWAGPDGALGTADDVTFTTTTDSDGSYSFPGLPVFGAADPYRVEVTPPAGYTVQTYDSDGTGTANQSTLDLGPAETNLDQDFGYRAALTQGLGDFVWEDLNGNGRQDTGEPAIFGVIVELYDSTGTNLLATTTTDVAGAYSFLGLQAGDYQVRFVAPPGYTHTIADSAVATDTDDSDVLANSDRTGPVTVVAGAINTTVDAGFYRALSVGDRVWYDVDGDGVQDAGEPGIPGATVTLTWYGPDGVAGGGDDVSYTATTDAGGVWNISNLPPGNYGAAVSGLPAGLTDQTAGVPNFTLISGTDRDDIDFGFNGTGSLGDRIWLDINGDGVQDAGEPGLVGIGVTLTWYGPDGAPGGGDDVSYTTVTGADGSYSFDNLPAGAFELAVDTADLPAGLTATYDLDGPGTPSVTAIALTPGQNRTDADFGYQGAGSIGDRVWLDLDADGVQELGEPGLSLVVVTLTWGGPDGDLQTAADNASFTLATDADGLYSFGGLPAGQYSVAVDPASLPAGLSQTYDLDGLASADQATATLAAGEQRTDLDFGYTGAGSIGDRVWLDLDGDGVQDAGEAGIDGATLTITWAGRDGTFGTSDDVLYTTVTNTSGSYLVDNLPAGSFQVAVDTSTLPTGLNPTFDADGLATPSIATVQLSSGQSRLDVDFGYSDTAPAVTAALGDRVWLDTNGNGVQDVGEPGIPGVSVSLISAGPDGIFGTSDDFAGFPPQITGADGNYQFTALPAGLYRVVVDGTTLPPGIAGTYELDGTLNGATEVGLAPGQTRTDVDFGYTNVNAGATSGSIGDRVWLDLDGDGVQDPDEPGIPGVTVGLFWFDSGTGIQLAAVETDENGNYSFTNLGAGLYIVILDDTTVPDGLDPSYELDGSFDGLTLLFLGYGENRTDVDFGFSATPVAPGSGSIGDRVWLDLNGDGVQDPDEPGLPLVGVTLTWYGADGIPGGDDMVFYTVTLDDGEYSFDNLPEGNYSVSLDLSTLPPGLVQTYELDGTRDGTTTVTLGAGQDRDDVDFGFRGAGSIGDRVWEDLNGNGLQDPGEPGIGGVTVSLFSVITIGPLGGVAGELLTTVTAADGSYSFDNLPAGEYVVELDPATLPGGLSETFELDGSMDGSTVVTLAPGEARRDVDFGYTSAPLAATADLGDRVWLDINGDGVQDPDEPGIGGARVILIGAGADGAFGTADDVTYTQLTAPDGSYGFSGLQPGDYRVIVDAGSMPQGLIQTYDLDMALDHSTDVTLAAGQSRDDVDFGYQGTGSIGDRVWEDLDGDGVQDTSEPGIPNVIVTLTWAGPDGVLNTIDDATFTALTDGDGLYSFDGLPAGSYRVALDPFSLAPELLPTYELDGVHDSVANVGLSPGQDRDDVDFGYAVPAIDVAIAKSDGGAVATAGGTMAYTLAYTNTGNYAVTGVTITETVPLYTSFSSAGSSPGWSCADGSPAGTTCTYTVGDLAYGASGTVTFAVTLDAALPAGADELSNTASIADDGALGTDVTPADNSATETTPIDAAPDLQLEKTLADGQISVDPGDLAVYSLRYRNSGTQDATGVTITETVPAHTSFSSAGSSPGWSCADGALAGTTCTYTVGDLAVGAEGEVRFAVRIDTLLPTGVTTIVNSASIADDGTNGADPTPPNNSGGVTSPFGFTAVTLLSFMATRGDDGVLVRWVTGAELETASFELYRSASGERRDAVRVTPTPILARGSASGGAEYSWRDTTAAAGVSYSYWLVERELDGSTHEYGPARAGATTAAGSYSLHLPLIRR